jgi:predicted histidine transporter YuiF (NhaC family)
MYHNFPIHVEYCKAQKGKCDFSITLFRLHFVKSLSIIPGFSMFIGLFLNLFYNYNQNKPFAIMVEKRLLCVTK